MIPVQTGSGARRQRQPSLPPPDCCCIPAAGGPIPPRFNRPRHSDPRGSECVPGSRPNTLISEGPRKLLCNRWFAATTRGCVCSVAYLGSACPYRAALLQHVGTELLESHYCPVDSGLSGCSQTNTVGIYSPGMSAPLGSISKPNWTFNNADSFQH